MNPVSGPVAGRCRIGGHVNSARLLVQVPEASKVTMGHLEVI